MLAHAPFRAASRFSSAVILLSVLTTTGLVSSGCDKVPLTAPAGTVITLVSTASVLPINGSTDIVAVLIESGTTSTGTGGTATTTASAGTPVHNGTTVSFTSSIGRVEPAEAKTTNGRATVKLIADGRSGRATITAFSGSAKQTLEVVIGAAAAERVIVTATPTSVPSIGGTAIITARVEDLAGNGLAGVPVAFSTTAGSLSSSSALTGDGGSATVSLSTTAAATVTASAGGKTGTAAIALRTATTLSLTVPSGALTVGAPTTFVVTPTAGTTLTNVVVNFGDGNTTPLGTISTASTVAHYYTDENIFVVRVTGTETDGTPVSTTSSVAVQGFTIAASASPTNATLGTPTTFTVSGVPTNVSVREVVWDFGNGITRTTNSLSTAYDYPQRGQYTAVITVKPTYGPSRVTSVSVGIN